MIIYLVKVSLAWAAFYGLYFFLFRRVTYFHFNRWYLVLSFLTALVLPSLTDWWTISQESPAVVIDINALIASMEPIEITPAATETTFTQPKNIYPWWVWAYWLGCIVMSIRFLYGCWQILDLFRKGEKRRIKGASVVITESAHLPFSFFNWIFWSKHLPLEEGDAQKMIAHEKAHIKFYHSFDVIFMELVGIITWCSPLFYLYRKALRITHEFMADASVVEHSHIKEYGHLLIKQSLSGPQIALVNHLIHSQLKKRIIMLTQKKSSRISILRYALILPLMAILVMAFANRDETLIDTDIPKSNWTIQDTIPPTGKLGYNEKASLSSKDEVFRVVEQMPYFKGCEKFFAPGDKLEECANKSMLEYIYSNITYPNVAKSANRQGTVVLKIIIDKNGKVTKPEITRSIGAEFDEVVLKMANAMPDWMPGKQNGKEVNVLMYLPIKFKLNEEQAGYVSTQKEQELSPKVDQVTFNGQKVYRIVQQMPRFKGCDDLANNPEQQQQCSIKEMLEFVYSNITYPKSGKEAGKEGTVVLQFIVDQNGKVHNKEVIRSIGSDFDKVVLDMANKLPNFEPGRQNGKTVNVKMLLPIKFRLENSKTDDLTTLEKEEEVFTLVEEMPLFKACAQASLSRQEQSSCSAKKLMEHVFTNIEYPKSGKENNIEGTTIAKFVISKTGQAGNIEVMKSLGPDFDAEVIRVIESLPTFEPGKQRGKVVNVAMTLPIKFKLNSEAPASPPAKTTISNALKIDGFKLTPNPAKDQVQLQFNAEAMPTTIRVLTIDGKQVLSQQLNAFGGIYNEMLDLGNAPRGTLIISIQQADKVYTEKLILQ